MSEVTPENKSEEEKFDDEPPRVREIHQSCQI
jgi:hypothetical protein